MSIDIDLDWDEDGFRQAVGKAAQSGFDQRVTELQREVETMVCPTHGKTRRSTHQEHGTQQRTQR